MDNKNEYPEHLRQVVDLIAAVLRRIKDNRLDKPSISCLHTATEGAAT